VEQRVAHGRTWKDTCRGAYQIEVFRVSLALWSAASCRTFAGRNVANVRTGQGSGRGIAATKSNRNKWPPISLGGGSYSYTMYLEPKHRHRALEAAGPRDYFGPSRRPPPGARMRVVTFVVSTFGSLGAQAQDLIKDIGRRTNLFVPFSLTHETSWATSSITTFLRSALTFQVRKRVAVILREHLPDDFLPPPIPTSLPLSESDQGNLVGNLSS